MSQSNFQLPPGMHGRFAIVKLWPEIKAAEDENIARFKNTAKRLGLKCLEITPEGEIINSGGLKVTNDNCDFVLHLHFETPKIYDVFSFVALWNPVKFYHDWGYARFSRNLTTHDDFISCDSLAADDHIIRLIHGDKFHLPPKFRLHHSLSEPIHAPTFKNLKLFYAGINWERLGKGKSRHQELLDRLDATGRIRIYGPKLFQGVDVWQGYRSYQCEIPFDGVSMVDEIAICGAALVLSSDAHKQSGLMSNRLFESLAAGALVICDENPFAIRHFGDTLLYIDCRQSVEAQYQTVMRHLDWAAENPQPALDLARRAQQLFIDNFALDYRLTEIYRHLPERRLELDARASPPAANLPKIRVFVLLDGFNRQRLTATISELNKQIFRKFTVSFAMSNRLIDQWKDFLAEELTVCTFEHDLIRTDEPSVWNSAEAAGPRLGEIMRVLISTLRDEDAFVFLAPNESLLSNHLRVLACAFASSPAKSIHATGCLLKHTADGIKYFHDVHDQINYVDYVPNKPNGFARFLINRTTVPTDIGHLLSSLDRMAILAFFALNADRESSLPEPSSLATVIIDITREYPATSGDLDHEICALRDYTRSSIFNRELQTLASPQGASFASALENLTPAHLDLSKLNRDDRVRIVGDLLTSILPSWLTKPIFWAFLKFRSKA